MQSTGLRLGLLGQPPDFVATRRRKEAKGKREKRVDTNQILRGRDGERRYLSNNEMNG